MSESRKIQKIVEGIPKGVVFTTNEFRKYASKENIRQILNRLCKAGIITRVARGVFVKPEQSRVLNVDKLPSVLDVANAISVKTGEIIVPYGANAARQLQFTSQTPVKYVFYTSGTSRQLKIFNNIVELKHAKPSKLVGAGTVVGLAISALNYVGKEQVTIETIQHLKNKLNSEEFKQVANKVNNMPAWMADIFYQYERSRKNAT